MGRERSDTVKGPAAPKRGRKQTTSSAAIQAEAGSSHKPPVSNRRTQSKGRKERVEVSAGVVTEQSETVSQEMKKGGEDVLFSISGYTVQESAIIERLSLRVSSSSSATSYPYSHTLITTGSKMHALSN